MKIPKSDPQQLERERMLYAGICPECGKPGVQLILTTAKDGCWSEHFSCPSCDYCYPNMSMYAMPSETCNHEKEVSEHGRIISQIHEITNQEHWELKPHE
jgi:hypothetical protein